MNGALAQSILSGGIIEEIRVEGTQRIDPETVRSYMRVDPGEPFDPELHEAMTMQPSADVEPDSVLTVIQKGYTLNGRLLRPARVIVAQASVAEASQD